MSNYAIPTNIDLWDAENVFYLKGHPSRLAKFLAQYELYKLILNLPGAVVECGVYKGASLSRFAAFRAILENDHSRQIYGFDAFGDFPTEGLQSQADQAFVRSFDDQGGGGISREELERLLAMKGHENVKLIEGNAFETVPDTLAREPHLRIALLHLDLDVYEPTRFCLDQFLPHITRGGLIVFDDYNAVEGATRVADELCQERSLQLKKLPFYNVPSFIIL